MHPTDVTTEGPRSIREGRSAAAGRRRGRTATPVPAPALAWSTGPAPTGDPAELAWSWRSTPGERWLAGLLIGPQPAGA